MSREQIIRDTAYAIWEAEGKPQGRDAQHWKQAEERVAASVKTSGGHDKPAKAKVATGAGAVATAPAKAAGTKAAPAKMSTGKATKKA